jgi:hypothetical protein
MKHIYALVFSLLLSVLSAKAQSYLGVIPASVNLREEPSKSAAVLDRLPARSQLFIYSRVPESDFYHVIDIRTDQEGWVHKSLVKVLQPVARNESGLFTPEGSTGGTSCEVSVTNDTSMKVTLKLNSEYYYFDPHQTKALTLSPGSYQYVASAPSVVPYYGDDALQGGSSYSWTFYVETSYGYGGRAPVSRRRRY